MPATFRLFARYPVIVKPHVVTVPVHHVPHHTSEHKHHETHHTVHETVDDHGGHSSGGHDESSGGYGGHHDFSNSEGW